MASEKLGMVPPQQIHNGLNPHPQLVFSEAFACVPHPPHRRPTAACDSGPKAATRELTACFLDHHHYFQPQPQQPPPPPSHFRSQWNTSSRSSGGDGSEDDDGEDENDDEEEEEDDDDDDDIVTVAKTCDSNKKDSYRANTNSHKLKHLPALGFKDGNMTQSGNECNNGSNRDGGVRNASGGEMYYSQYLNGEGPSSSSGQKDIPTSENDCGFRGNKEGSFLSESGESLRAILSDPLTGTLMEDAMILPCGHSFGTDGIQQVIRMKICYTCSQPVLEDSIAPNLSLRLAVQAFMREEELHVNNMAKRRRERYEHKGTFGDSVHTDLLRGKGVQFPFAVTDRVIIKGNKRTPQRFVGREAIVTTQCLNGWYVVKTLDSAESVKLQYRSLAKVADNPPSKASPIKGTPNWL